MRSTADDVAGSAMPMRATSLRRLVDRTSSHWERSASFGTLLSAPRRLVVVGLAGC